MVGMTCLDTQNKACKHNLRTEDDCENYKWDISLGSCIEKIIENCSIIDSSDSTKYKTCENGYTLSSDPTIYIEVSENL